MYAQCWNVPAYFESIHFTTAGATTAWPGLPRLTGSNGPPTTTTAAPTATVTITMTQTNGGAIAGSIVGGIALGVLLTLAIMLGMYIRQRKKDTTAPSWSPPHDPMMQTAYPQQSVGATIWGGMIPTQPQVPELQNEGTVSSSSPHGTHEMDAIRSYELDNVPK